MVTKYESPKARDLFVSTHAFGLVAMMRFVSVCSRLKETKKPAVLSRPKLEGDDDQMMMCVWLRKQLKGTRCTVTDLL